jgi:hypothetical protein
LIAFLIYFLYKIVIASLPVDKAYISYARGVSEGRKNEIGEVVKKVGLEDLKELKVSIETLSWVESVNLHRNILRKLNIEVIPRVPVAQIEGDKDKVVDKQGFIFNSDVSDSLPVVKLISEVQEEGISRAIKLFEIIPFSEIDKMEIRSGGVITKYEDLKVIWGSDGFKGKYEILKRILEQNKKEFKGCLDFRFKNMVILRR